MKLKSFTALPFSATNSPGAVATTMPSKYLYSNPSSDSDTSVASSLSSSSSTSLDSRATSYLSLDDDNTFRPLRLLPSPLPSSLTAPSSSSITAIALSSSSSILFSATAANKLSFHDTATSSLVEEFSFSRSAGSVKSIVFIGPKLITAHQDGKIRVWKPTKTGSFHHYPIATLPTMFDRIRHFAFPTNYVRLWRHGRQRLWIEHHDAVSCVAVNESLGLMYTVSWDKTMKIWSVKDGFRCLESVNAHSDAVNAVVVSRSGVVFTGSADKTIRVWQRKERNRHALVATLERHGSGVNALAVDETDDRTLFSGSGDRSIVVWERTNGGDYMEAKETLRGHDGAVLCLIYGGDLLFSGSADRTVRIWRRGSEGRFECLSVLAGHRRPVKAVAATTWGEDGVVSVFSGGLDGEVKVWRVKVLNDNVDDDDYKCD